VIKGVVSGHAILSVMMAAPGRASVASSPQVAPAPASASVSASAPAPQHDGTNDYPYPNPDCPPDRPRKRASSRMVKSAPPVVPAPASAGPIVKSVGGKGRLLPFLRARLPATFGRFVEPFCGGAALFFDLARPGSILGDANVDLIETYAALVFDVEAVISALDDHAERHAANADLHYYATRSLWNDPACEMGTCERAATYLYLHRVCFNGLHRVSKTGKFNVPIGRYKNPTICDPGALRAAAALLSTAKIIAGHFATTAAMATVGDLAYFDPPYDGGSFTAYTPDGFNLDEQISLARTARDCAARGVHVMLSNHDTALVHELYREACWHVREVSAPRSIAASGEKRGDARELLITSYPAPGALS
jgi:DNA adenine methylase